MLPKSLRVGSEADLGSECHEARRCSLSQIGLLQDSAARPTP